MTAVLYAFQNGVQIRFHGHNRHIRLYLIEVSSPQGVEQQYNDRCGRTLYTTSCAALSVIHIKSLLGVGITACSQPQIGGYTARNCLNVRAAAGQQVYWATWERRWTHQCPAQRDVGEIERSPKSHRMHPR